MAEKELSTGDETKEPTFNTLPAGVDDASAIPKGQIDPVYEAKARVLNHAVRVTRLPTHDITAHHHRFKRLVWDGINGNSLL
jgi:hypothetical protein